MGTVIDNATFEKYRKGPLGARRSLREAKKPSSVPTTSNLIKLDNRRTLLERERVNKRINSRAINEEMRQNAETVIFEGSRTIKPKELPRSLRELKRFLGKLSNYELIKIERLVEDITLDARVRDRSFTCTMLYLSTNKDPEIPVLYKKIRAALFVNLGVMLPEIPDDVA